MKSKSFKTVKGIRKTHVCTGTMDGDLRPDFPFNIMLGEHKDDFPMHGHEYSELNIVIGGSAVHMTDYENYEIEEGDVFIINGDHKHGFVNCKNLKIAIIQFSTEELSDHLEDLNQLMGYHGLFDIEPRSPIGMTYRQRFRLQPKELTVCKGLFKQVISEFDDQTAGYKTAIRGLFVQLVTQLSRFYESNNQNEDRFAVTMANVVSYICQSFRSPIRIEDLAKISGLSVSQFQRRFKLIYNTTPIKMIHHLRAEEAAKLLQNTDYDLNQIAEEVGYNAASFFSTQFKQLRGVTPREFRKKCVAEKEASKVNVSSLKALILTFILSLFMLQPGSAAAEKPSEIDLLFLKKIKPMLEVKCWGCHGEDPKKIKGEYIMLDREKMLKGGESGKPAVVPGDASKSYIMSLIEREDEDDAMPPKEADKLTSAQVGWVEDWINAGAPWPDEKLLDNDPSFVKVDISGALSDDWANRRYHLSDIWAFQPVQKVTPPKSTFSHPIDKFIDVKLKAKSLTIASQAKKEFIIRRAYLNLIGIDPTYEEVQDFVNDTSANAFEKAIDKLLASKHYGEYSAQNWLDVVRYADTGGYANDWELPHVWRYRDYVIRSFNQDKPYDQFVKEQIAGDEMDPKDPEYILATGFLRTGPWEHTGMSVPEVTRQLFLDDVTETVGKTFLAQPLICAKCHDHKFDPIPTQDFYRIQAVFATTHFQDRKLPFQKYENVGDKAANIKLADERIKLLGDSKKLVPKEDASSVGPLVGKQTKYFKLEKDRYLEKAFSVMTGKPLPDTRILTGGSIESPGAKVSPGVLSAVYASNDKSKPTSFNKIPSAPKGRRLAFAKWVASEKNTLTARVMVNRIWQQHFSRGIVATPNSFGKMGAKPTHPQLLDYLAGWFVENNWSVKKLHKFIMMSKVYQMSNEHKDLQKLQSVDPDNKFLAYYPARRIQAEVMYDSLLKKTGELNMEMGGPGIFPEINWEVALQNRLIMGTLAPVYQPSPKKKDRDRRNIYAFVRRGISNPLLEVFNKPGSELSCAKRDETTVTPQAFSLFNSAFVHNRALALANTISKVEKSVEGRVIHAFKLVYGRVPSSTELKTAKAHVEEMVSYHKNHKINKKALPEYFDAEFIAEKTGRPVTWRQFLNNLNEYERDLMPWQVDSSIRGLYELCLVLVNSNEFLYVY